MPSSRVPAIRATDTYLARVAKEYRAASMLPQQPVAPPLPQQQQPEIKIPEYDAYAP